MHRYLFLGVLLFFIVYCSTSANSQDNNKGQLVRGFILDKFSNVPIEGALVELLNHSPRITAISNADGSFEMQDIPVGRQRIRIEHEGFYENIVSILVDAGKEVVLDIDLEEEYKAVATITSKRKSKKEDKRRLRNSRLEPSNKMITVSYRKFEIEEVTRYPGGLEDPARLIANFPGMYNIDDPQNYIVSRGNSPFGIHWQVEGVPMDNPHHLGRIGNSGAIFPVLNTNLLADSDFLNGAFSAEYGNAFSGVFDINMRKGNNQRFEFTGELSLLGAEVFVEGPFKKGGASFMISCRYSVLQLIKLLGFDTGSSSSPGYGDLNFKIDVPTKSAGSFSIFGIGGLADVAFLANKYDPNDIFAKENVDIYTETQLGLVGISHKKFIKEKSYLKTTASYLFENYTSNKDSLDQGGGGAKIPYYTARVMRHRGGLSSTFNTKLNTQLTFRTGGYGYLFLFDIKDNDLIKGRLVYDSEDILFHLGGFAQVQYKVSPRFVINAGVHAQYFSLNNRSWAVEPRIALNWYLGKRHQLSLGYGWHSKIQPFSVSFYVEPEGVGQNAYNTSNRDLGFIRSHHLVLSYNLYLAQQWALKANVYGQYNTNIPISQTSSSFSLINHGVYETPQRVDLIDDGIAFNAGTELSIEKFFSKGYHGIISGAYFRSRYRGSDGVWRNTAFDVQYVLQVLAGKEFKIGKQKRNAITLDLRFNHRGGTPYIPILLEESIAQGKEVRDYENSYAVRNESYTRIDIKIGARFNPRKKKISHYFFIDFINVGLFQNARQVRYDAEQQKIVQGEQFGLIPNLFYRIQF
ncbi:TonB-dependent receptor [Aureispira sp. CCB-E]|uniref:TonB-dependent receptor n=1 Tax=Aureispira sp. CCB-E TaxID=3051121 RepID=UPI0028694E69|nr:TonB-dependent receptor [Aureispira sp. CCB-E]WMX13945.1 TonB-dependent receptor [Aureispira sp. CCB-E]